jgi:hypothetical protein
MAYEGSEITGQLLASQRWAGPDTFARGITGVILDQKLRRRRREMAKRGLDPYAGMNWVEREAARINPLLHAAVETRATERLEKDIEEQRAHARRMEELQAGRKFDQEQEERHRSLIQQALESAREPERTQPGTSGIFSMLERVMSGDVGLTKPRTSIEPAPAEPEVPGTSAPKLPPLSEKDQFMQRGAQAIEALTGAGHIEAAKELSDTLRMFSQATTPPRDWMSEILARNLGNQTVEAMRGENWLAIGEQKLEADLERINTTFDRREDLADVAGTWNLRRDKDRAASDLIELEKKHNAQRDFLFANIASKMGIAELNAKTDLNVAGIHGETALKLGIMGNLSRERIAEQQGLDRLAIDKARLNAAWDRAMLAGDQRVQQILTKGYVDEVLGQQRHMQRVHELIVRAQNPAVTDPKIGQQVSQALVNAARSVREPTIIEQANPVAAQAHQEMVIGAARGALAGNPSAQAVLDKMLEGAGTPSPRPTAAPATPSAAPATGEWQDVGGGISVRKISP